MYLKRFLKYNFYRTGISHTEAKVVFIACMPKTGSTYISTLLSVLNNYDLHCGAMQFAKHNEQDIYEYKLKELSRTNCVIQQHARATENNISLLLKYGIRPIVLVRDIYDILLSLYDHIEKEDPRVPTGYIHKEYFLLNKDAKIDYLIKIHLPWFFNFLISWREASADVEILFLKYEEFFADKFKGAKKILDFYGLSLRDELILEIIEKMKNKKTRLNKGVSGRGGGLHDYQKEEIKKLASVWGIKAKEFKKIGINL